MKLLSVLFLIIFQVFNLSAQNASLSGSITDAITGEPLTGAHVLIFNNNGNDLLMQAVTGRGGGFSFTGLPAQKVKLTVTYVGYKLYDSELNLTSGAPVIVNITLIPSPIPVGEVTVSALRRDKLLRNISLPMAVVTSGTIDKLAPMSMSEIISQEPGVSLARDGIWGTSVNIRGLSENRIVTLVDGNRIETSTDIAAGLAMIDVNDIERIEVIKGAASSLYGTGAMGGVVNIITKEGRYNDGFYVDGRLGVAFQDVNRMHSEHAAVEMGGAVWNARISGSYRDAENTMTPSGELPNSQFTDNNISLKAGFKPAGNQELKLNYQRFYASDVGIPGGKAFPVSATASFPEELRELFSAEYNLDKPGDQLDELKLRFFYQYILRDVILKPSQNVTLTPTGYHTTLGVQLQSGWKVPGNNYLVAGFDLWQRYLKTERERTNHVQNIVVGEIPIPESWYRSAGVFFQDEKMFFEDRLKLTLGGRLDLINVENEAVVDPFYIINNIGVKNVNPPNQRRTFMAGNVNNYSWSTDLGLIYNLSSTADLTFTASRAYRAPSLDERFKYIDLGATVRLGDPNLKPEQGYFFDLGTRIWHDRFQFSVNTFINLMSDMIVEIPGEAEFPLAAFPDSSVKMNALINSNVDKAMLYGIDLSTNYNFYNGFVFFGSASIIRGIDTRNDEDLPFIPPVSARTGLRYKLPKWFGAELAINMVADQDKIAEGETETRGYSRYDLSLYSIPVSFGFMNLSVYAGIENITDRAYVNHLATNRGFIKYEPGRNVFVRVNIGF